jgi:1-deoxy-D-xylulose-5-phosphate synthase
MHAADILKNETDATVINARFAKPLDREMVLSAASGHEILVTMEEAYLAGGFGSAVIELLESEGLLGDIKVIRLGVPDEIVSHGNPKDLLAAYNLDADGIVRTVRDALQQRPGLQGKSRLKAVK